MHLDQGTAQREPMSAHRPASDEEISLWQREGGTLLRPAVMKQLLELAAHS